VVNIVVAYSLVAEEINSLSVSSTYLAPGNSLKITYQVELASGTIKVYSSVLDSNGNTVRTLENGIERANGTYTIYWDGKDDNGNMVSDGTYTIKVRSAMGSIKSREWQLNDGPLNAPRDIAFEKDGKYAWVTFPTECKIRRIDTTSGSVVLEFGTRGGNGPNYGEFFYPMNIDVDDAGNIYVVDRWSTWYKRIYKGTPATNGGVKNYNNMTWEIFFPRPSDTNPDFEANNWDKAFSNTQVRSINDVYIYHGATTNVNDDRVIFVAYLYRSGLYSTLFCFDTEGSNIWVSSNIYNHNSDYYSENGFITTGSNMGTNWIFLTSLRNTSYIYVFNLTKGKYHGYITNPYGWDHYHAIAYYKSGNDKYFYLIQTQRRYTHNLSIIVNSDEDWSWSQSS